MKEVEIKNIDDAVEFLIPFFEGMKMSDYRDVDHFAAFCHSQLSGGIGMQIRNMLGFWTKDTPI